jgi:hypothetical protein
MAWRALRWVQGPGNTGVGGLFLAGDGVGVDGVQDGEAVPGAGTAEQPPVRGGAECAEVVGQEADEVGRDGDGPGGACGPLLEAAVLVAGAGVGPGGGGAGRGRPAGP